MQDLEKEGHACEKEETAEVEDSRRKNLVKKEWEADKMMNI